MIGRLKGIVVEKQPPYLLIDVGGVGYEMQVPMTSFYPLPAVGEPVLLHTHLSISENAHQLFGFYTLDERQLFRTLVKVSGVGPKMALAILSGMPVNEFVACVRADNVSALVRVPGVGKKTAERLIIEVKDKLQEWQVDQTQTCSEVVSSKDSSTIADAESALVALGYRPNEAAKMISTVKHSNGSSEELIRLALQGIAS